MVLVFCAAQWKVAEHQVQRELVCFIVAALQEHCRIRQQHVVGF